MIAGSRNGRMMYRIGLAAGMALLAAAPAFAQDDELEPVSRPVVQPLPNQGGAQLNAALTRLAANPNDVAALLDAGNAALALGDTEAAMGFYGRADQLAPGNARVKSALAIAMVRNEDPFAAIPLFDAAEKAGAADPRVWGERGLAYDLVGANSEAQRYYRQALAAAPGDEEIARRLALSLAIAGDRKGAEAALLAQLRNNEPAGWRTRAFTLAILGDTEEAVRIAQGTMPRDLSEAMIPYLRYMGRLTPAQQAAAANFGHFPRAAQIGRDDPRIARYAALYPRKPVVAQPAAAAKADPKARKGRDRRDERAQQDRAQQDRARNDKGRNDKGTAVLAQAPIAQPPVVAAPPTTAPVVRVPAAAPVRIAAATPNPNVAARQPLPQTATTRSAAPDSGARPAFSSLGTSPAPQQQQAPVTTNSIRPTPAPAPVVARPAPAEAGLVPSAPPSQQAAVTAPRTAAPSNLEQARQIQQAQVGAAPTPVAAPARANLASAFGDFRPPAAEQAAAPAVDLAAIERERARRAAAAAKLDERGPPPDAPKGIRRVASADPVATTAAAAKPGAKSAKDAKAEKDKKDKAAKAEAPKHPSRIWVQIGVGRDKGALAFDWRKYQKSEAELFKGRKAWTTPWVQTNRLLIGPFETQAAAQAFLKDARKQKIDAFVWTSPAGQAIDALAAK